MLIYTMSVSVDGFIADREGAFDSVQGNARLAEGSVAEEVAAALAATDKDISIRGADLAAAAIELGLVGELRVFRVRSSSVEARRSCRRLPRWSRLTWSKPDCSARA